MPALVPAPPDAADQGAEPRAPIDAVHGAAAVPLRRFRQQQLLEVEIEIEVIGHVGASPDREGINCHGVLLPLCVADSCS